jgi:threonine 3-dehydrogenase
MAMKALVKKEREKGLWLEDVPEPQVGDQDVLIKIYQTAICGTDIHIYKWDEWAQKTIPVPMHVGHEFMGEIVKLGKAVTGLHVGEKVSGEGHIVCGHCRNCRAGHRHLCVNTVGVGVNRPGAFAEFLSIPASNVFPLPPGVSDDEASILDPLGNAVHTTLSFDLVGEDVLITGAGPIGIMAGSVALHIGARHVVITDINEYRLKLAEKMGIKNAIDIRKTSLKEVQKNLGMTEGFDVGLEMSGNATAFSDMIENMKNGGKIALLGILPADTKIAWDHVIFKGLFLKGIYGREIFETWYKMCAMIQSGLNLKPIFTHRYPVKEFKTAFETMLTGNSGKIILDWRNV